MATRSNIGIRELDGKVRMIYCHWDGSMGHHGPILLAHYNTLEKVETLLALGDLSTLGKDPLTCEAYHRDKGETLNPPRIYAHAKFAIKDMEEYMYLFDCRTNSWIMTTGDNLFYPLVMPVEV